MLTAMCKELLTVTDILDPTSTRLCIYTGVILYELHCALMDLASRNPDLPESFCQATEAKGLLEREIEILKHEPDFTPGGEMRGLAKRSLPNVKKWLEKEKQ